MEINTQANSALQQAQLAIQSTNPAASETNSSINNTSTNTSDTLSISSEAKARFQAEQSNDNTVQLTGSGGVNGTRPK